MYGVQRTAVALYVVIYFAICDAISIFNFFIVLECRNEDFVRPVVNLCAREP